jgi:predicted SnoaL-like aldol condensation-catalyzing enzyme
MCYKNNTSVAGRGCRRGAFAYGNFVLTVSAGTLGGRHTSFYDLFRVQNGKSAEHLDVIEPIAPRDQWKNQNGKFGF